MQIVASMFRRPGRLALASVLLIAACGLDDIVSVPADARSRTIDATVGQGIHITLGNVGPAIYETPPRLSTNVIEFLGVDVIPPFTPAGPTQLFRFRAIRRGEAVIHFRRLLGDSVVSVVEDTIRVR